MEKSEVKYTEVGSFGSFVINSVVLFGIFAWFVSVLWALGMAIFSSLGIFFAHKVWEYIPLSWRINGQKIGKSILAWRLKYYLVGFILMVSLSGMLSILIASPSSAVLLGFIGSGFVCSGPLSSPSNQWPMPLFSRIALFAGAVLFVLVTGTLIFFALKDFFPNVAEDVLAVISVLVTGVVIEIIYRLVKR